MEWVSVKRLIVDYPKGRMSLLAARKVSKGESFGSYYGSLEYTDIYKQPLSWMKPYEDGSMAFLIGTFNRCAIVHSSRVIGCRGVERLF